MKISVVTATYNAVDFLPDLINSLRQQENKNFEWVVADGVSTDGTLELLRSIEDLQIVITSESDFGIYDALNRGIKASSGEFYLVVGADDVLYPNAIEVLHKAISEKIDIVTTAIDFGEKISRPRNKMPWFYGQFSYVSGHSVGSAFRKSLHDITGYYSRRFPIAADQFFILNSVFSGAKIKFVDEVIGKHNLIGVSATDDLGTMSEWYRVQVEVGFNKYLQTLLFVLRVLKNIRKV